MLPRRLLLRYAIPILILLVVSILFRNLIASRHNDDAMLSAAAAAEKKSLFYFVQVNDPQFGVKNAYRKNFEEAMDWSKEEGLFRDALEHIVRLNPKFVVIGGDMQHYYPKNEGSTNGILSNYTEAGPMQANDCRAIISNTLVEANIPVQILPGNHDLDDAPDTNSLNYYNDQWESYSRDIGGDNFAAYSGREQNYQEVRGQYYHFTVQGVVFIVLNSQFYYDDSDLLDSTKYKQTKWFESIINDIQKMSDVKNVVVLTHIPPFGGFPDENHGWANWRIEDRNKIMSIAYSNASSSNISTFFYPSLWLCGHFHGNAQYAGPAVAKLEALNGINDIVTIEVVVTNSVTSPMEWDGVPANEPFSSEEWINVATIPSAADAFEKYIVPDVSRITGGSSKAGLRFVEFFDDGSYRHKYFTIDEIAAVQSINDATMVGSTFQSPPWDNSARKKAFDKNPAVNDN